ncbi:MAG: SDR family oxidoreductase [Proteobacteria bacterium]|nr:SDR family oxidoreductase [Pseudomonadota bacterium]
MPDFANKTIIITGASEGIGRALALELAPQAPRLVLAARNRERLESLAKECEAAGATTLVCRCDITGKADCETLVRNSIDRFGQIDILVNNAGATMWAEFSEVSDLLVFRELMDINYLGAVYCTHFALPYLLESRGLIVAVASLAGLTGVPSRTGYAASKHAMVGFFDSLRIELRTTGVGVCIIAPDFVVSQIHRRARKGDGEIMGDTPMQEARIMSAEDCAALIAGAMRKRQRLLITSVRGKLGRWLKLIAPTLIDRIAERAIRLRR